MEEEKRENVKLRKGLEVQRGCERKEVRVWRRGKEGERKVTAIGGKRGSREVEERA